MDGGPTDPPLDPAAADEADANDSSAGSKLSDDVDPGHPAPGPVAESSTESIGTQAARGVLWMTAQNWLARAGGLVTIAILTRLLAPEDFGLLAVAQPAMNVLKLARLDTVFPIHASFEALV